MRCRTARRWYVSVVAIGWMHPVMRRCVSFRVEWWWGTRPSLSHVQLHREESFARVFRQWFWYVNERSSVLITYLHSAPVEPHCIVIAIGDVDYMVSAYSWYDQFRAMFERALCGCDVEFRCRFSPSTIVTRVFDSITA